MRDFHKFILFSFTQRCTLLRGAAQWQKWLTSPFSSSYADSDEGYISRKTREVGSKWITHFQLLFKLVLVCPAVISKFSFALYRLPFAICSYFAPWAKTFKIKIKHFQIKLYIVLYASLPSAQYSGRKIMSPRWI